MFEKYKVGIGLEIGDGLVKAMRILSNSKFNQLVGLEMKKVDFREGRQVIGKAITEVLTRLQVKAKEKVNTAVSGESVLIRDIHWPQMNDAEIRKALQFEVERQIYFKPDEIVFDYYSVIDKSITETKTRVTLVAAKKDLIENYTSLIVTAGFNCGFVEVDTFSFLNCFYVNGPTVLPEKTIAIINVGNEVTNINIIKSKVVEFTKDSFVAWTNLINALPEGYDLDFNNLESLKGLMGGNDLYELSLFILNSMVNQIRRTIESCESQGRDTVSEIFLSGRIAMYKNLDNYLFKTIGLKVTIWNPTAKLQYNEKLFKSKSIDLKKDGLMLAVCSGLACHRTFDIDLSGKKKIVVKENKVVSLIKKYKAICFAAVFIVFLLGGLWITLNNQIHLKERKVSELNSALKEMEKTLKEIDNLEQGRKILKDQINIIKTILSRRTSWSRILQQISKNLPKGIWLAETEVKNITKTEAQQLNGENIRNEDILLVSGKTRHKKVLFLVGYAYAEDSERNLSIIKDFINNLKADKSFVKIFQKIELVRSMRQIMEDEPVMRFEVKCF